MIKRFFNNTKIPYYKIPLTKVVIVPNVKFKEQSLKLSEAEFYNLCKLLRMNFRTKTSSFLGLAILMEK
jgi:hypothetical protein